MKEYQCKDMGGMCMTCTTCGCPCRMFSNTSKKKEVEVVQEVVTKLSDVFNEWGDILGEIDDLLQMEDDIDTVRDKTNAFVNRVFSITQCRISEIKDRMRET